MIHGQSARDNFRLYEPPMSRRDLALEAGYDPSPEDLLPPAAHLIPEPGVDPWAEIRAFRFVGAQTRCKHPHCNTSLTPDTVNFCPHDHPFCELCTWEDGCHQCAELAIGGVA